MYYFCSATVETNVVFFTSIYSFYNYGFDKI